MDAFLNQAFAGLSMASILLMVALGLAIIYGAMGVINLAHGEFVMLGAYSAWLLQTYLGLGILVALPVVFLMVALVGLLVERGVVRWLYHRPLDTILATWGVSLIASQGTLILLGPTMPGIGTPLGSFSVGALSYSNYRLVLMAAAPVISAPITMTSMNQYSQPRVKPAHWPKACRL